MASDALERYQALQVKAEQLRAQVARHEGTLERIIAELQDVSDETGEKLTTVKDAKKWIEKQHRAIEKDELKLEKLITEFDEKWGNHL